MAQHGNLTCKVCSAGAMTKRKVHRLSGPAVVIGYLLVIPSILGILGGGACVALSFSGGAATTAASAAVLEDARGKSEPALAREALIRAGVSEDMADRVVAGEVLSDEERGVLSVRAASAIDQAPARLATPEKNEYLLDLQAGAAVGTAGAAVGATLGVGAGILFMVASLIGGLLGYLLIMKKRVLQCSSCGATIAAS